MTRQEALERLVRLALFEGKPWADRRPIIREEMERLGATEDDLLVELRNRGVQTAHGPVSSSTVSRWMRGVSRPPDSDQEAALLEILADWARGRFLSAPDLAYIVDPKFSPRMAYMEEAA